MEVIVGKLAGFCPGVENAVNKAMNLLKNKEKIYCLGDIVHNENVIKSLMDKGIITVYNLDEIPNNSKVIFRAHGEAPNIYEEAKRKNLEIIDLTCGKVKAIHIKVEKERLNAFIIVVGKKNHPETIGTIGFAGENSFVIESEDDILDAYIEYEKTNLGRVYVVSQTTFSSKKFDEIIEEIKVNFIEADVIVDKTICETTENRQKEAKEISSKVNKMIIIGGKNSSNTKELARVSENNCGQVYFIQNIEELKNINFIENDKIGIMAGASTPKEDIENTRKFY